MTRKQLLLIALLILAAALQAESRSWKWIGPRTGTIDQLEPDRNHPGIWYSVNTDSLYRSNDAGLTWTGAGITNVLTVAVVPGTSDVVVITRNASPAGSRVLLSRDLGITFKQIADLSFPLRRIYLNPADPAVVYGFGLGNYDLAQSTDGGRRWTTVSGLPFAVGQPFEDLQGCTTTRYEFNDFLISPFDAQTVYASVGVSFACGLGEGGCETLLLVSHSGGKSWDIADREDPSNECVNPAHFHTDPLYKRAFLFNSDGIQALTSKGFAPISNVQVTQMVSVPRKPDVLFALQNTTGHVNVIAARDAGRTWQRIPVNLFDSIRTLAAVDAPAGGLLAGTDGAGLYFRDNNTGWHPVNNGFRESRVVSLQFEGQPGRLLAVTADETSYYARYLFSTDNGGESWRNLSFQLPAYSAFKGTGGVAVNPNDPGNIILSGGNGANEVRVSKDDGKTWQSAGNNLFFKTFDPSSPHVVYYAAEGKIYRSVQSGLDPQQMPLQLGALYINRIHIDANNHNTMFFLTEKGVYRSNDGGKSAHQVNAGLHAHCSSCDLDPRDMAALPQSDGYLLVLSSGDVYRTLNSGDTWEKLGRVEGFATRILAADSTGLHFFLLAGKLFESVDGGKSWRNISNELAGTPIINNMTDPRNQPIYLATSRGVFVQR